MAKPLADPKKSSSESSEPMLAVRYIGKSSRYGFYKSVGFYPGAGDSREMREAICRQMDRIKACAPPAPSRKVTFLLDLDECVLRATPPKSSGEESSKWSVILRPKLAWFLSKLRSFKWVASIVAFSRCQNYYRNGAMVSFKEELMKQWESETDKSGPLPLLDAWLERLQTCFKYKCGDSPMWKDFCQLGFSCSSTIVIDDNSCFRLPPWHFSYPNLVKASRWEGDMKDTGLVDIMEQIEEIAHLSGVTAKDEIYDFDVRLAISGIRKRYHHMYSDHEHFKCKEWWKGKHIIRDAVTLTVIARKLRCVEPWDMGKYYKKLIGRPVDPLMVGNEKYRIAYRSIGDRIRAQTMYRDRGIFKEMLASLKGEYIRHRTEDLFAEAEAGDPLWQQMLLFWNYPFQILKIG